MRTKRIAVYVTACGLVLGVLVPWALGVDIFWWLRKCC